MRGQSCLRHRQIASSSFSRLVLWRLARPAKLIVENSPNVVGMILHAEHPLDHFPYPRTGPQLVAVACLARAAEEDSDQPFFLPWCQTRLCSGAFLARKAASPPCTTAAFQRDTEDLAAPTSLPTSLIPLPCNNNRPANRRRASICSRVSVILIHYFTHETPSVP